MGLFSSNMGGVQRYSNQLLDLQVNQAVFGTSVPVLFGTLRLSAKLLFYGGFQAVNAPNGQGKGFGGGKSQEFEYYADVIAALASGSATGGCRGLLNVWDQSGKLENQSGTATYTIPTGGGTFNPSPGKPIQADLGVTKSVPYSIQVNDYGSGGTQTLSGNQNVSFTPVSGTPGTGEYTFDPSTSSYTFSSGDAGTNVTIEYSGVFSLFYFEQTQAAQVPLASPYSVSTDQQQYFYQDLGVINVETGVSLNAGTDYTESGGVYTFSSALAGVFVYITYSYTSSDPNITNTASINLTVFGGTLGQTPWSYMQSKYSGSAYGYTGICYVGANPMALGTSGAMPSYNYEVVGLNTFLGGLDCHPLDMFTTLLTDEFLGVGFPAAGIGDWTTAYAYLAANSYLISKKLNTPTSVADAMTEVLKVGNVAPFFSEGVLKIVPYGNSSAVANGYTYTAPSAPAATLTWDDLLGSGTEGTTQSDPIEYTVRAPQDCHNYMQANWCNRENDYNNDLINEQNDTFITAFGQRTEAPQTWDWITNLSAASWALNIRLKRACYLRTTYKFALPFTFSYLEPMDLVVLPTGESVRLTAVNENDTGELSIEAEQWAYGVSDASIYPKQSPSSYQPTTSTAAPGNTFPVIFETAPVGQTNAPNAVQIAVAGTGGNWGGCEIYASTDGQTYEYVGTVNTNNCLGVLTGTLPVGRDPDTTDTLSVDLTLSGGSLTSATQAQADAKVTLCAIVDASGNVELVTYETATLTATGRYNLTYLRRGVYGTPISEHVAGARFSFIGIQELFSYQYPAQFVGQPVYFKFPSFNLAGKNLQSLSVCPAYEFSPSGTLYVSPTTVGISQSATPPTGAATAAAAGGVAPTSSGGLTAAAPIWLTVTWDWPANNTQPTGFEVIAFTGTDPTATDNYLFPIATVGPTALSYSAPVQLTTSLSNVNAAVRAIYA